MRGRAELSFDFYDDWDQDADANGGLLGAGWGNDELDRLLAGSGSYNNTSGGYGEGRSQPRRKRGMSYGTRQRMAALENDPTVIPSTSKFGFLGRLPWKVGGTLRYKPSAADLQENLGGNRGETEELEESEPLMGEEDDEWDRGPKRKRSSTASSGATSDSFRSRGDLFPSDAEDDAVPLGDEFAMVLERRTTSSATDDQSSGKTRKSGGKKSAGSTKSRNVSRTTLASENGPSMSERRSSSAASGAPGMRKAPSIHELQEEEAAIRMSEDAEVEKKRQAARRLAEERGLNATEAVGESMQEMKHEEPGVEEIRAPSESTIEPPNNEDQAPVRRREIGSGDFVPARLPTFG